MHTLGQQRIILPDSIILSNAFLIKKFPIFLPTESNAILAFQCHSVIDFLVQELNFMTQIFLSRSCSIINEDYIICKENTSELLSSSLSALKKCFKNMTLLFTAVQVNLLHLCVYSLWENIVLSVGLSTQQSFPSHFLSDSLKICYFWFQDTINVHSL